MDPSLTLFFYLLVTTDYINNLLKKICRASIFLILVTIKKFIDLKSKTKYTSPKKNSSTTKITNSKTFKKIKLN